MLECTQSHDCWAEKSPKAKGFTLVELLVVIVILSILAIVVVIAVNGVADKDSSKACMAEKRRVETAIKAYKASTGEYPSSLDDLTSGSKLSLASKPKYWKLDSAPGSVARTKKPATDCPAK